MEANLKNYIMKAYECEVKKQLLKTSTDNNSENKTNFKYGYKDTMNFLIQNL